MVASDVTMWPITLAGEGLRESCVVRSQSERRLRAMQRIFPLKSFALQQHAIDRL